mgnify:CR=1 FL=1
MNPLKVAVFHESISRISRAIKTSMEQMEAHLDEPIIADYFANLEVVSTELESTLYAVEQMELAEKHHEKYH